MRRLSILLSVVLTVLVLAPAALTEWFADAYLGPAITSSSTLTFTTFGEEQKQSLGGRSSPLFGLRFGRWLEDFNLPWLGMAADVSYFRPATDVQAVPLSLLVMARYGFLKDDETSFSPTSAAPSVSRRAPTPAPTSVSTPGSASPS